MKAFRVSGQFLMGHDWQRFVKDVAAEDDARARETLLSDLGSRHGVRRTLIQIQRVREVSQEEIRDPAVEFRVKGGR